jgi:3-methyladenine DNA glycosylase AlkD
MQLEKIMQEMKRAGTPRNREGMERFAITGSPLYGCGVPFVRKISVRIRHDITDVVALNALAINLWNTKVHEAKLLATMIADESLGWGIADKWVLQCNNWAEVDQLCSNLLWKFPGVEAKAVQYAHVGEPWKKRTGFVLMAVLAVRRGPALEPMLADEFFSAMERECKDGRNFVKKAVNWALRQVGKSTNKRNWRTAMALATKLSGSRDVNAKWIGTDAKRELATRSPRA